MGAPGRVTVRATGKRLPHQLAGQRQRERERHALGARKAFVGVIDIKCQSRVVPAMRSQTLCSRFASIRFHSIARLRQCVSIAWVKSARTSFARASHQLTDSRRITIPSIGPDL